MNQKSIYLLPLLLAALASGCHSGSTDSAADTSVRPASAHPASPAASQPGKQTAGVTTGAAASGAKMMTSIGDVHPLATGGHNFEARGIYSTGWSAGSPRKLNELIGIIHKTGLNSIVIDVKDSDGSVSYYTPGVPLAVSIGACSPKPRENRTPDIDGVLKKLKAEHIHSIGRVVCFNDPILARKHPEWAIRSKNGGIWHGRSGHAWVDPTVKALWKYNVDLAEDAIKRGFDEVQWDYVRFPSDGNTRLCVYHQPIGHDKAWTVIAGYLNYGYTRLSKYNVPISADIFGLTGTAKTDMGIGQKISPIAGHVDIISPMVYPSHFAHGEYHEPNPNTQPYRTVFLSLRDAKKRIADTHTLIRPWLQAFSLFGVHYGPPQVLDQLKAARDDHLSQFLFWNAQNKYDIVLSAFESSQGKQLLAQLEANAGTPGTNVIAQNNPGK